MGTGELISAKRGFTVQQSHVVNERQGKSVATRAKLPLLMESWKVKKNTKGYNSFLSDLHVMMCIYILLAECQIKNCVY